MFFFLSLSLRMAGADTKVKPQLIVIQTTSTESLSQNGPAPGRVSTLTGPRPGTLWKIQLVWSLLVCVNTESVVLLSHRQGYAEDYHRANRSAYDEYYANYSKNYDYRGMSLIVGRFSALPLFTR